MSLTDRDKKEKDRALARREIQKNPDLLKQVLARVFGLDGGAQGKDRSIEQFAYLRKRAKHLDQAIVSILVGDGFIRPAANNKSRRYTLTNKGRATIDAAARLDRSRDSCANSHIPGPGSTEPQIPAPSAMAQMEPIADVPEFLINEMLIVASKKERAKAERRAAYHQISYEYALCAGFIKAAGNNSLEKYVAQRRLQHDKQAAASAKHNAAREQENERNKSAWKLYAVNEL